METNHMIDQKQLKELLDYNPETGAFTWKIKHSRKTVIGKQAGSISHGYVLIRINGILYRAHRLAWLYMHGVWPSKNIDHINRQRHDNKFVNLRDVGQSENMHNAGMRSDSWCYPGVDLHKVSQRWRSRITVAGKVHALGYFTTMQDAISARKDAEEKFGVKP